MTDQQTKSPTAEFAVKTHKFKYHIVPKGDGSFRYRVRVFLDTQPSFGKNGHWLQVSDTYCDTVWGGRRLAKRLAKKWLWSQGVPVVTGKFELKGGKR